MKPVCLVMGAGAGIGGTVGARFAKGGYHAVLCRRSDREGLDRLVQNIHDDGGDVTGMMLNAVEPDAIEDCIAAVERDIGPVEVLIYNLGAQVGNRSLDETTYKTFELGWRMATFGLFRAAKSVKTVCAQGLRHWPRITPILWPSTTRPVRSCRQIHGTALPMPSPAMTGPLLPFPLLPYPCVCAVLTLSPV